MPLTWRGGAYPSVPEAFSTMNLVGFDPRGVGSSLPLIRCESAAAFQAYREGGETLTVEEKNEVEKYDADQCFQNTAKDFNGISSKDFIQNVGTINTARDIDVLRSVLNQQKMTYFGASYGSVLGYQYASLFPHNVRALVIDGIENQFWNNPDELAKHTAYIPADATNDHGVAQAQELERTFRLFLSYCLKNGDQCPFTSSDDPVSGEPTDQQIDRAYAEYQELTRQAFGGKTYGSESFDISVTERAVSFSDIRRGTMAALYNTSQWKYLMWGLQDMKLRNNPAWLLILSDGYYDLPVRDGYYLGFQAAFETITCVDRGVSSSDDDASEETVAPWMSAGTNADGTPREVSATTSRCAEMNLRPTLPAVSSLPDGVNVLVLSTAYDFATPYWQGVIAADAASAPLVIVSGSTHVASTAKTCASNLTSEFLSDPSSFKQKLAANQFTSAKYTGQSGQNTKDIYSHPVIGSECQLYNFGAVQTNPSSTTSPSTTPSSTVSPSEEAAVKPQTTESLSQSAVSIQSAALAKSGANVTALLSSVVLLGVLGSGVLLIRRRRMSAHE